MAFQQPRLRSAERKASRQGHPTQAHGTDDRQMRSCSTRPSRPTTSPSRPSSEKYAPTRRVRMPARPSARSPLPGRPAPPDREMQKASNLIRNARLDGNRCCSATLEALDVRARPSTTSGVFMLELLTGTLLFARPDDSARRTTGPTRTTPRSTVVHSIRSGKYGRPAAEGGSTR